MSANIDLGVSLYGFTERFIKEDNYSFEEMFQELNKLGITKFEVVGAQMFKQYPNPTDEEINEVVTLANKYNVEPFSYGGYVDFARRSDRLMTDDEIMNEVTYDLMTAKKLGCKYIRGFAIPARLYTRVAQMAGFYQIKVCYEIHAPATPTSPEVLEMMELFEELQSPWIGFVPDFGIFIERPNQIHINRFLGLGAKQENLDFIIENRWNNYTEETIWAEIESRGGQEAEKIAISEWFGFMSFAPADIEGFKKVVKYAHYYHAKFYHIGEDCLETTIPYKKLLAEIVGQSFNGTIMIEYEGHSFYLNDAVEQISRHIQMEKQLITELNK